MYFFILFKLYNIFKSEVIYMINKKDYLSLKKEIRCMCRKNVLKLCDDMELTDTERKILIDFYDNETLVSTCIDLNISNHTYNTKIKILFSKIKDYKNTL